MKTLALVCCLAGIVRAEPLRLITQAQLDVIDRLIAVTPDGNGEKPDLLFRRATMHLQLAHYYRPRAEARDKSEAWLRSAVKLLLELADDPHYANYARQDEVVFTLADELTKIGREDLARKFMKRLLADHPKSRFVPQVYLSFGDYYFEQGQLDNARLFYQKLMEFPATIELGRQRLERCKP